jgi:two-component system sensor histidine kinase PilS (NtrC family)
MMILQHTDLSVNILIMLSNPEDIIYPCPFSKAYGIPTKQAWLLLKIFFLYRVISSCLLVSLFYVYFDAKLADNNSLLYQYTSMIYLTTTLLTLPFILTKKLDYSSFAQLFIFTDIIFITLLMHADGGVQSGIGILLAISIASGGLLIGGRCSILFAALASLAILSEQIYDIQAHTFDTASLTYSGLLGVSFFSIVLLSYMLAKRTEQSAILANHQTLTIAKLEELNRHIIQHLQSGIMIVNAQQEIQLSNQSALKLLNLNFLPTNLASISTELQQAFAKWQDNNEHQFAIIQKPDKSEIQIRFSLLTVHDENMYMLIFEDIALYNQRLQQTKLASLGRLTASIAHEIRNPLSAISHAAQLLSEAPNLQAQEIRLTEIIQNHSRRVNNIIEDILKLSRPNQLRKQKIVLDFWLPAYLEEQHFYSVENPNCFNLIFKASQLNVFIDPGHLKQILNNLCGNALLYGNPDAGKIRIEVDRHLDAPCIKVIDNGPGIAADNLQHLFEPFFTTSHKGTGLGLFISRQLAELNQAELSYAKQSGKSCFKLVLANADQAVIEI